MAWPGKTQSKQQSTEKTGVDVWPNVSSTLAELRSQVIQNELDALLSNSIAT